MLPIQINILSLQINFRKMKEPKEIYYLPVEQLSDDVIQYIEKVFELLDAVKNDCNSNNFSRRFTFIRDEKAISDVAEIKKDNNKLNHIYINENFCQYLWSVCVYLIAYFENVIHIPMMDAVGINKNGYKPNMIDVEYGNDCFFRGRQLLHNFNRDAYWVTPNICNPQQFENIISHANDVYCAAIAFIYAHEFSHNYLGHTQIQQTLSRSINDEIAADDMAISFIQTEYNSAWGRTYKAGIATTLAALLLMGEDSISGGGTHPDMDVRIENLVTKLELHEMDLLWGYLGVALRLWLLVFDGLSIKEDMQQPGFGSYKEIYLYYIEKLKIVRQQRYPTII